MDHGQFMEQRTRNSRAFILGAGFSAGAGIPLTDKLLPRVMETFARDCPGLYSRVDNYAKTILGDDESPVDYSKLSLQELCTMIEYVELNEYSGGERWSDAGCREKLALRFYLAKTIADLTPTPVTMPPLYLEFAAQLHEGDMVISFNWDVLLEIALMQVGKRFTYSGEVDGSIKLCKLHGSINWRVGPPEGYTKPSNELGWEPLGYANGVHKTEIYHTPRLIHPRTWDQFGPLEEVQPFLVLPGYGKAFDVRHNAWNWYKPINLFVHNQDVFIIGLSLSVDDFFVRSLFLNLLPYLRSYTGEDDRKICIINPGSDCEKAYDFILSKGSAQLISENFSSSHIELMSKSREDWNNSLNWPSAQR